METFVMSRIDDHEIDCYHQYVAQTNYRLERPEDGDGMMFESLGVLDKPQEVYNPVNVCLLTNGPRSFGDVGYRPQPLPSRPRRAIDICSMNNARNGHRTPQMPLPRLTQRPRSDCGDYYYNSYPGSMSPQDIRDRYYIKF